MHVKTSEYNNDNIIALLYTSGLCHQVFWKSVTLSTFICCKKTKNSLPSRENQKTKKKKKKGTVIVNTIFFINISPRYVVLSIVAIDHDVAHTT